MQADGVGEIEQILLQREQGFDIRLAASAVVSVACKATASRCGRSIRPCSFRLGSAAMCSFSVAT